MYRKEQAKDEDITWAIEQVKLHKDKKPSVKEFTNNTRQSLYRNYSSLRVINDLLYHEFEDSLTNYIKIRITRPECFEETF